MSYEALDPIRTACKCHIVFVQEQSSFHVMGKKAKAVQEGLRRLRTTCFQIAARQIASVRLYLLHWPDALCLPTHVYLEPYYPPTLDSKQPATEPKLGNAPRGEGVENNEARMENQTGDSEKRVRRLVLRALLKLHYFRGHIRMRLRFGEFLAQQFRQPKDGMYSLEEYEDMIKESQFAGYVTQE